MANLVGVSRNPAGGYTDPYSYLGSEKDAETNLQYLQARYYNSVRGVFLSQDSVFRALGTQEFKSDALAIRDPQSLNSYAYARNSPYTLSDPSGQCFWDACIAEGFLTAAAITWVASAAIAIAGPLLFGAVVSGSQGDYDAANSYLDGAFTTYGIAAAGIGVVTSASPSFNAAPARPASQMTNTQQGVAGNLGSASGRTVNGSVTIPSNWIKSPSDSGGGFKYTDPNNPINEIRLMPGTPNARFEVSRSPYMRIRTESGYTDINGVAHSDGTTTHIPITSIHE